MEEFMGIVSEMNLGLVASVVAAATILIAFVAYMAVFGRKSSLRQKNISELDNIR
jgi:purine-cytosine permease-like protein